MSGRITQAILHLLDRIAPLDPSDDGPEHLRIGRRGEEDAYFYLRRRGYTMIARNYRSPHHRGEIDLIGWQGDILCFIEVKTRTTRDVKPAEAAVDREKQNDLRMVARDFLRQLPSQFYPVPPAHSGTPDPANAVPAACRFDIVSVYYDRGLAYPSFELFQNAFSLAYNRHARPY